MKNQTLFGFHAVVSRLRHQPQSLVALYVDAERNDGRMRDLLALAQTQQVKVRPVARLRLDGMAGHARHQGVVAEVTEEDRFQPRTLDEVLEDVSEAPLLLVLDGVQDPHNLGAALRVADALGAHAVVAPRDRAAPLNAAARKVACGAADTVPFIVVTNLVRALRELQEREIRVVGADSAEDSTSLHEAGLTGPLALVLGAEGEGLRRLTRETCDERVRIPMLGSVESLNVSVASGIFLYEVRRQRAST